MRKALLGSKRDIVSLNETKLARLPSGLLQFLGARKIDQWVSKYYIRMFGGILLGSTHLFSLIERWVGRFSIS